jgi:hypothetical protein
MEDKGEQLFAQIRALGDMSRCVETIMSKDDMGTIRSVRVTGTDGRVLILKNSKIYYWEKNRMAAQRQAEQDAEQHSRSARY